MMKTSRFITVSVAIVAVILWTVPAVQAADVKWKMATKMPPSSPEGRAFQMFADQVKEQSQGRMVIEMFPMEQLGKTQATMEMLQAGVIQIYAEGTAYLRRYVPATESIYTPFVFVDRPHWARFMDSELVKSWYGEVAQKHNIMILGKQSDFVRGPYRVIISKRPIKTLDDLKGLKLRMPPADTILAVYKYLGANVIVLPWTEIYESLGRGIIEGCTSPVALVESMKFYEQAKYVTRWDEFPQGLGFMTNNKQYRSLSPDLQKVLLGAHKKAAAFSTEIMAESAAKSVDRMKKKGTIYSVMDPKPIGEYLLPLYEKWEKEGKLPSGFLKTVAQTK